MNLRVVGIFAGIAIILTACGGGSSGTPVAQPTGSSPPIASATPTPTPVPVGPKGIITWSDYSTITGYDPVTNQQSNLRIPGRGTAGDCTYLPDPGGAVTTVSVRQSYSPNFDKVTWCSESAGSSSIGYIDLPSGLVHNLTPDKGSSYGAQSPQQVLPIFNPKTGDLWFYDVTLKSFMSFDLSSPGQAAQKRSAPVQVTGLSFGDSTIHSPDPTKVVLGNGRLVFSADGSTLATTNGHVAISSDGKSTLLDATTLQRLDGAPDADLKWAPDTALSSCAPYPGVVFIDLNSFLCTGTVHSTNPSVSDHSSLYRVTIDGSTLTPLQLLPDSENEVQNSSAYPGLTPGFIVSPDKQIVAFVSKVSGEGNVLFTVSLKGGEPTRIGPFTGTMLIDWK